MRSHILLLVSAVLAACGRRTVVVWVNLNGASSLLNDLTLHVQELATCRGPTR